MTGRKICTETTLVIFKQLLTQGSRTKKFSSNKTYPDVCTSRSSYVLAVWILWSISKQQPLMGYSTNASRQNDTLSDQLKQEP